MSLEGLKQKNKIVYRVCNSPILIRNLLIDIKGMVAGITSTSRWAWSSCTPMTDDIIAVPRPLVSVNDLIGGTMRAVRGVWDRDSGATIIHWVVELEGGVTRRGRCCVGVVFEFPVSVCENCL